MNDQQSQTTNDIITATIAKEVAAQEGMSRIVFGTQILKYIAWCFLLTWMSWSLFPHITTWLHIAFR
jgi:hypothetical protein